MGLTRRKANPATSFFSYNELNTHFHTAASRHPRCTLEYLNNILKTQYNHNNPFQFATVSTELVRTKLLKELNKQNSISPDGILLKYLDKLLDSVTPILTDYYNQCIQRFFYPNAWKQAYIIPLNKIAKPLSPNDTRPISNLSHFAKVFDADQLKKYLKN